MANFELGLLTEEQSNAILRACKEILEGKHHDQFPVDMIQGGAGTILIFPTFMSHQLECAVGYNLVGIHVGGSSGSVSYTHLDVYKRQEWQYPATSLPHTSKPARWQHSGHDSAVRDLVAYTYFRVPRPQ